MKREMLVRPSLTWAGLWRWLGLLLIVVLLASGTPSGARESEPAEMPIPGMDELLVGEEAGRPTEFNPKLDSALNQLLEARRTDGMAGARAFAETRQMVLEGDRVQVVLVTEPAAIPGLAQAVEGWGGEIQGDYAGLLQVLVPVDALEPLAARSDVQFVREPRRAIEMQLPEAGSFTTEGVTASNAAAWHSAGYDGTGVRVAVIDAGFTGYSTLLGSDLPSSVGTYDWTGFGMGGTEHGTACAEIVHDMAPGAMMDLHKVSTVVELNQAVTQAIADGADVISMSLGWTLDGPGDGTGPLANIVNTARSNGILYATAAGNEAEVSWSGQYADHPSAPDTHQWPHGNNVNCFGPGTPDGSCYNVPAGYPIVCGLRWDDWTAVTQDYDLYLVRWTGSTWTTVASSTDEQSGAAGQTPEEFIGLYAPYTGSYGVVVARSSATRDVCFSLNCPKMTHLDEWVPERSVTFPGDSPDAITVGAVDVNSPYPLESYSSQGPTFGPGGACSGGAIKPDIASYANVSTVSYGAGYFNGTSAATPHVAGAAALVKQRYPGYSVTQLQDYLENEALDLGTSGKDTLYGSGRLYLPGVGNTPPTISGLPDQTLAVNTSRDNAIDLWAHADDAEDSDADLLFTISNTPDPNAGVSIDSNRYIDINPTPDWTGTTDVEIQVEDTGGLTDTDTFQVRVMSTPPPEYWVYLPMVLRNYPEIPQPPSTPNLYSIDNSDGDGNYRVCWSSSAGATSYMLHEDDNGSFTSPTPVYSGPSTCWDAVSKPAGTYYYRVNASNDNGPSSWSNVRSVTVSSAPPSIVNGNFEAGPTAWTEYSTHGWDLILHENDMPVSARSGSWAVWLGGDDNDISYIQQQVTVPPSQPYLRYWHWIASQDFCGYDFGGVVINGSTVVDVYTLCSDENTGGWVPHIVNLGAYAGQSVSLQIRVETDGSLNSNLFVDDVFFSASALAQPSGHGVADDSQAAPRPGAGTQGAVEEEPQPARLFRR